MQAHLGEYEVSERRLRKEGSTVSSLPMRLFQFLCYLLVANAVSAQSPFISYAERTKFALAPSGALDIGLYGYANPALLSYVEGLEQGVAWSDSNSTQSWGLFTAMPRLGFGMINGRRDSRVPSRTQ